MDLVDVLEVISPRSEEEIPSWSPGDAYVAGGTWLFSEPQPGVRRLIDLSKLANPGISVRGEEVVIPSLLTYQQLQESPSLLADAGGLFFQAIRTLSSSFKTWGVATVGGNVCLAYAKSMMAPTFALLDATYELLTPGVGIRQVRAREFQTGVCETIRRPGEFLREIRIPRHRLTGRFALKKESYTRTSHATVMLLGRMPVVEGEQEATVTVSAATVRPVSFEISRHASTSELLRLVEERLEGVALMETGHGSASYGRQMIALLAEGVWTELREGV
ncbi:MAG: FAD binding domain-containing protein [Alkalispirochaetaceae bacterium]